MEALNNSPLVTSVGSKTEEVEHLNGSRKADDAAFLLNSHSGDPDRDQPVLPDGQAIFEMSRNLEKETSVPSRMGQLTGW